MLHSRVQATHNSLQLREFFYQLGREISFRQAGRLMHNPWTNRHTALSHDLRKPTTKPLHAQGFLVVAAQIFLKGDVLEQLYPFSQRNFLIRLPEETRIVETCSQHALMPMPNDAFGIAIGVQNGKKMRRQLAIGVLDSEILLVVAHHCDQHFFRQFQKFTIKITENDGRKLRQINHGVE